jgi:NTP pyrophosphatase (non-canonical NTP hydrolase)
MGLSTESAEVLDAVKKHIYYGKELDLTNLVEELGDIFWYAAILVDSSASEQSFESIMERNIAKLRARYGERFSEKSAIKRDLTKERRAYA